MTTRPPAPNYIFTRYTQGQRGTIFDARGVTLAVTKPVWEYRLDSLEATKDPVNPRKPITPQRRMEKPRHRASPAGATTRARRH